MKKYFKYFKVCIKSNSTYKADYAVQIITNMVYYFIFFALWKTIYETNGTTEISNFTLSNTVTYYLVTSLIFRLSTSGKISLNDDIWSGYLTNDLTKPWSVKFAHIFWSLSQVAIEVVLYIPFWIFMVIVSWDYINLPGLAHLALFLITIMLGLMLNMAFMLIWHTLAFYFGDQDPTIGLVEYIVAFLSGGIFPLAFLHGNFGTILSHLPFRFIFNFPATIFLEKIDIAEIVSGWGQMVVWIIVFYSIFSVLLKGGLKRYEAVGR